MHDYDIQQFINKGNKKMTNKKHSSFMLWVTGIYYLIVLGVLIAIPIITATGLYKVIFE